MADFEKNFYRIIGIIIFLGVVYCCYNGEDYENSMNICQKKHNYSTCFYELNR